VLVGRAGVVCSKHFGMCAAGSASLLVILCLVVGDAVGVKCDSADGNEG
jgi:hypothetical protein